jgi:hypothetical protein
VKAAGYSEAQVIEIVANVAINFLTDFVNNVARTDIDFPSVRAEVAGSSVATGSAAVRCMPVVANQRP